MLPLLGFIPLSNLRLLLRKMFSNLNQSEWRKLGNGMLLNGILALWHCNASLWFHHTCALLINMKRHLCEAIIVSGEMKPPWHPGSAGQKRFGSQVNNVDSASRNRVFQVVASLQAQLEQRRKEVEQKDLLFQNLSQETQNLKNQLVTVSSRCQSLETQLAVGWRA